MSHRIELIVNDEPVVADIEPRMLLSDYLRHELELTGTHVGCEQGGCGACTVQLDGRAIRSCLLFAVQADGHHVRTVEALSEGLEEEELHPLQQAFRETHALQCGFCTPGFLMSIEPLLAAETLIDEEQIRRSLGGNLCRCTGYAGIVKAAYLAASRMQSADGEGASVNE